MPEPFWCELKMCPTTVLGGERHVFAESCLRVKFYPSGEPGGIHTWTGTYEPMVDPTNRESAIRWLCWNDRNGCYTDEECEQEFGPGQILTLETALGLIRETQKPACVCDELDYRDCEVDCK